METASWACAVLALTLAGPIPLLFARARWPQRFPRQAVLLWQIIALTGGVSMISAMVMWGLSPVFDAPHTIAPLNSGTSLTRHTVTATIASALASVGPLALIRLFAVICGGLLFFHLMATLVLTGVRLARQRRRHAEAIRLVARRDARALDAFILESSEPVAYCLPTPAGSMTVLSAGALDRLSPDQLSAVLAHERAHLFQRHDLLRWAFLAWKNALIWLPTSHIAYAAVAELTELMADDAALASHEKSALAQAIVTLSHRSPVSEAPLPAIPSAPMLGDTGAQQAVRRLLRLL